jgi:hypothetical protein
MTSDFDTKLKLRYLLSDTKHWLKKSGLVRTQTNHTTFRQVPAFRQYRLIWYDEDWRDRPRTDPSSVSDLGTGLEVILVLKRLDFSSTFVSRLLAFSSLILSSIKRSRFLVRSGLRVRYCIEYRASYLDLYT